MPPDPSASPRTGQPPACPICGKPRTPEHRPFCSARCKLVDLGRWFGEGYRVETDEVPDQDRD